jgi:lambda family phage tail tape measure protein
MATIEDFILRMKVEGEGAVRQVSGSIQTLKDDIADLSQFGGPLGNTINGIVSKLGAMGVVAGVASVAISALGGRALQIAGELSDIAGATGIAAGQIRNFQTSLIEAGGKAEDASVILSKLNQSVQEAAGGNEKLQQAFRTLGVFVTDANGKMRPTGDILADITAKAQRGEITQQAYAAAVDILGKSIGRLEISKLSALRDPVMDEDIRRIDSYNEAIDKVRDRLSRAITTFFGSAAEQAERAFAKIDELQKKNLAREEEANRRGNTRSPMPGTIGPGAGVVNPFGIGAPAGERPMSDKEKKAYADRMKMEESLKAAYADRAREENLLLSKNRVAGGFGAPDADKIAKAAKDAADLELKIFRSLNDEKKNILLQFAADEEAAINVRFDAELALSRRTITDKKELAAKIREIESKRDLDVYNFRTQLEEKQNREAIENKKKADAEAARIESIITQSKARTEEETRINDLLDQRNRFVNQNVSATDRERANAQALFDLEQERLKVIRQISLIKDLPEADRLSREKEINAIFDQRREKTITQQQADKDLQDNFSAGFSRAYRQYAEDSKNSFNAAGRLFSTVTKNMEDSFVEFAKTGKFEFKGFMASILEEILRSRIRQMIAGLFGSTGGGGRGGLFGGSIIPGFLAKGGPAIAGQPYIVGEKGAELFVPNASGSVIPNGQFGGGGGSMVTYNINAVDASSFKQLVASDPGFIYAVTEQGRRILPQTRR